VRPYPPPAPARRSSNEQLAGVPAEVWRELGERLVALDGALGDDPILETGAEAHDAPLWPLRAARLRARSDRRALAMRALWLHDPVTPAEIRAVLGAAVADALLAADVLVEDERGVVATLSLAISSEGRALLAEALDRGGDAVMGVGALTSVVARAAMPEAVVDLALDLGAGAGAAALEIAPRARRVIATDVNPRAAILCRVNALLAGVTNVEARVGDLFEPVRDERFARVMFQPPFVPVPASGEVYAAGGERGDELALRAMRECLPVLAPSGRAVLALDLPIVEDEPVAEHLRRELGPEPGLLVIEGRDHAPEELALGIAAHADPHYGERYAQELLSRLSHFAQVGIRAFKTVILVVTRPTGGAAGATGTVAMSSHPGARILDRDASAWLAAIELAAAGPEALARARLKLREGLALARLPDGRALVHADGACPIALQGLGPQAVRLLDALRSARSVGELLKKERDGSGRATVTRGVVELLRAGVLEI
jgi:SAM-dependent methyltransferase